MDLQTNVDYFSFEETGSFSKTVNDYLAQEAPLQPFYRYAPEMASFAKLIEDRKSKTIDRALLRDRLIEQYAGIAIEHSKVKANIDTLLHDETFTITTGHQLGLFTGPLYFVYKIISVINLTEKLKQEFPQQHFVPVFWMASEDHDFAEINHVNLYNRKLAWDAPHAGAVGRMDVAGIAPVLDELTELFGDRDQAQAILELLRSCFKSGSTLTVATRQLVHSLFERFGLVIVDGDDAWLKATMKPIFERELKDNTAHHHITATSALLGENYKIQVTPREINLFYLTDGLRERIVREGERFQVLNSELSFSEEEILRELEVHPERFSPNVVMRPVYQETILPNLAYIGGGGEIAYWFQLKAMFDAYGTFYPMLLIRNSVMWLDAPSLKKINKLGLPLSSLFMKEEELVKQYVLAHSDGEVSLAQEEQQLISLFDQIAAKAEKIDPTLVQAIKAEGQRQAKAVQGMEKRMLKAEKRKQETSTNQLRGLKQKLFPNGGLQERHDNYLAFALRYGDDFIDALKQELDVMDQRFVVISEQ